MSNTLYRKYRPTQFKNLAGQDHVKAILLGSLISQKVGQVYLFSGPRGTGKTTTARILAKALNCPDLQDGEPCNQCPSCQLISEDRAVDIIEIDAASHRGIDEIRDLRERVKYSPTTLKKKVYIIDEAHMLTNEAFNALLKTLEEPPEHSVFILATTEPHKIPATIQSRAQRLNFHLGSYEQLAAYLREVANQEKIQIDDDAISLIAINADGGFRDALSILEQVAHQQKKIDAFTLRKLLGLGEEKAIHQIVQHILDNQQKEALLLLDQLNQKGASASHVQRMLIETLRNCLRQSVGLIDNSQLPRGDTQLIIKLLSDFVDATTSIRQSFLPFLPLEIVIAKNTQADLLHQISNDLTTEEIKEEAAEKPQRSTVTDNSNSNFIDWSKVVYYISQSSQPLSYLLKNARITSVRDDQIRVEVRYKFHADRIMDMKNRQMVESAIERALGKKLTFYCSHSPQAPMPTLNSTASTKAEQLSTEINLSQAAEEILG